MHFETLIPEDLQMIGHLQPPDWSDIIPPVQYYIESDFCIALKSMEGNRVTGIGALINYTGTSWLAHIIVDPEFRKKGTGTRIVELLLQHPSRKPDAPVLLSATPLGETIYNKLGFRPAGKYVFFKRERPWNNFNWCEYILPYKEDYKEEILVMDHDVTGENRSSLIVPELTKSFVYVKDGHVAGFFLPSPGEGTIIAGTREAGLELMKVKFSLVDDACLPEENEAGISFLKSNGFAKTEKTALRMILGREIEWEPLKIYSRIGGNFG